MKAIMMMFDSTPGGAGHARKPPRYLSDGTTVVTEIEGIGRLENTERTP